MVGVPQDTNTVVVSWTGFFMNDDLSFNWLTILNQPYSSYQHTLYTTFKYNDKLSFLIDTHIFDVSDPRNAQYVYRDKTQVIVKAQYQF